jgi:integrase
VGGYFGSIRSHISLSISLWTQAVIQRALETCPRGSGPYFFWTGLSTVHTATGLWQRTLKKLFQLANVPGGHADRYRDTFAVEFLLSGGTLEQLSVLLGHSSVRITERHYSPWVRERQIQLEANWSAPGPPTQLLLPRRRVHAGYTGKGT